MTSIVLGVPGEGATAATVLDGYAMTKKGEAGRALGASFGASLVGSTVGRDLPRRLARRFWSRSS